ncbi:glycerophosphoryl diester phosphodiesterase family protein [Secundilactobacillus pentosiphilus]|uniref:Glycerophosphoryl diester phosphodiesterase family protein n=1 Tax=Secundilactobacillus pentosiphilus TaxID=1714682 RepID=A0A1Z5INX1_9LACO|nr:glycerophosphodiester phosphodiesterase [Secundilactobacillus pentosiphilus]GAX03433.1 glycerophosphoryl diester phosphodiesterase family protein [Secundilactobacillus pentosiphilus]
MKIKGPLLFGITVLGFTGATMGHIPTAHALSVRQYNVNHPLIISHRGSPLKFPEHSYAGYNYAIKHGSHFIEQDVVLSKDKQLIDSHDNNLKRTLGRNVNITSSNYRKLKRYKFKNGEHLHTLPALFKKYGKSTNYVVESKKSTVGNWVLENKMVAAIKHYHVADHVILQSFNQKSLAYLHRRLPHAPTMLLLTGDDSKDIFQIANEVPKYVSFTSVYTNAMKPGQIEAIHATGKKAIAYTIDNRSQVKQAKKAKVDGIFTDDSYFTEKLF